jgi:hypothetical protein
VGGGRRGPYRTGVVSKSRLSSPSRIHRWIVSRLTPSWRASALLLAPCHDHLDGRGVALFEAVLGRDRSSTRTSTTVA